MSDNSQTSPVSSAQAAPPKRVPAQAPLAGPEAASSYSTIFDRRRLRSQREKDQEESNSERWLVSYADFITLVMVLFMMLYALQLVKAKGAVLSELRNRDSGQVASETQKIAPGPSPREKAADLMAHLRALRDGGEIKLSESAKGVEIEINARMLFTSGDSRLLPQAVPVLKNITAALGRFSPGNILVEGHTDSVPISNGRFESNWELSSARAGAVVRYFVDHGIEPSRLIAMGRSDNVPAALGTDPESLAANRRVTILVQY
nr:OmpA family protein [Azohydromonas australica]